MFTNYRRWVGATRVKGRDDCISARAVAKRNRDISQPGGVADAPDSGSFGVAVKFFFAPVKQLDQLGAVEPVAGCEIELGAQLRVVIPRAH